MREDVTMWRYTCPKEGCDWWIERPDVDGIWGRVDTHKAEHDVSQLEGA